MKQHDCCRHDSPDNPTKIPAESHCFSWTATNGKVSNNFAWSVSSTTAIGWPKKLFSDKMNNYSLLIELMNPVLYSTLREHVYCRPDKPWAMQELVIFMMTVRCLLFPGIPPYCRQRSLPVVSIFTQIQCQFFKGPAAVVFSRISVSVIVEMKLVHHFTGFISRYNLISAVVVQTGNELNPLTFRKV